MSEIFQIMAEMTKAVTMANGSVRLQFDSQENVSAEALKRVFEWRGKPGWLLFLQRQAEPGDVLTLPEISTVEEDELKPSVKMRRALHVLWTKRPEGFKTDEEHYKFYMEKYRQHVLAKIPED
jgi:hypothetical protein